MKKNFNEFSLSDLLIIAEDLDNTLAMVIAERYEVLLEEAQEEAEKSYERGLFEGGVASDYYGFWDGIVEINEVDI